MITFRKATLNVMMPRIKKAINTRRLEEYPKKTAVFKSAGSESSLIKLKRPDKIIIPLLIVRTFFILLIELPNFSSITDISGLLIT